MPHVSHQQICKLVNDGEHLHTKQNPIHSEMRELSSKWTQLSQLTQNDILRKFQPRGHWLEKSCDLPLHLPPGSALHVSNEELTTSLPPWVFHWWRLETTMFLISSILHSQIRWLLFSKTQLDPKPKNQNKNGVAIYKLEKFYSCKKIMQVSFI